MSRVTKNQTQHPNHVSLELSRGEGSHRQPLGVALANPAQGAAGSGSTRHPSGPFLESCWVATSSYWCLKLLLPRCRTLNFPLLILTRFPSAPFSSLCPWMADDPLLYQPLCPQPPPVAMALPSQQEQPGSATSQLPRLSWASHRDECPCSFCSP